MKKYTIMYIIILSMGVYFATAGLIFDFNPTNYPKFNFIGYVLTDILMLGLMLCKYGRRFFKYMFRVQ